MLTSTEIIIKTRESVYLHQLQQVHISINSNRLLLKQGKKHLYFHLNCQIYDF